MNAVATLESLGGAQPAPGPRLAPEPALAAAGSTGAPASGAASFRSSWQSMLLSLGAQANGKTSEESAASEGRAAEAPTVSDQAGSDARASQAYGTATAAALTGSAAALASSMAAGARLVASRRQQLAPGVLPNARTDGSGTDDSRSGTVSKDKSGGSRPAGSAKSPGRESSSSGAAPAGLQAAMLSAPPIATIAIAAPAAVLAPLQPQFAPAKLLDALGAEESFLAVPSPLPQRAGSGIAANPRAGGGIAATTQNPPPAQILEGGSATGLGKAESMAGESDSLSRQPAPENAAPSAPQLDGNSSAPGAAQPASLNGNGVDPGADSLGSVLADSAAELAGAAQSGAASDRRSTDPLAARTAHENSAAGAGQLPVHALPAQLPASGAETSGFARDPSGSHGSLIALRSEASGALPSASAPGARETFAALDGGAGAGTGWIHAGAHSAEAGFEDPALGWVGVRADLGANGVHAAVVPGSAEAVQALGGHMAGLNAYLSEHHAPVETVTLAAPDARGAASGMSQEMQQGSGHNADQDGSSGPRPDAAARTSSVSGTALGEITPPGGAAHDAGRTARPEGTYISVMA